LIKSLDVPLINVAIRDVSESSRSSPRPMQPNPWLTIRDKIKSSRIATHMAAVASYVDDDVASYVDDDVASYVDDDVASYVDDDVASTWTMMWHPTWTMTWHPTWTMAWQPTWTMTWQKF
jgi:hypothetical protein